MNNTGRVDVFHAPEYLVDEELNVVVTEFLGPDDGVQVSTH